ncbi:3-ketosteroid-delta-1-dehydrogenase [Heterostelium album PN500]|uniref:3-ketosteroid-delta-1-dehydrogenase n=1 Tax=Heterostelium pallidum (strain ATCC 26659 / Pp 5 / PN500) TaxID=670386 RepID=D3BPR9_HETP5|nr:3-ketosteroid-delta-1-dehydrogenase [Heterostelium album PN500]EFA76597.1 3-ketosteroid-delta-1-dehydrogenase [Heterostelium album PN500]|eukprot:XP_020428729.1 3-ketosteroid-delta-1-dehydrogenase [Heterostelium album PN500]
MSGFVFLIFVILYLFKFNLNSLFILLSISRRSCQLISRQLNNNNGPIRSLSTSATTQPKWDHNYDVVVVGSGAGGMTASITAQLKGLKTLLIEKDEKYGGTSSMSGGALWIPNNLYLQEGGVKDSVEEAKKYLDATVGDDVSDVRKMAYLTRGPEMLQFLHDNTNHVRFQYTNGYSDYYPERPGGHPRGRSIDPVVFDSNKLGSLLDTMLRSRINTQGIAMTSEEFGKVNMFTRTWKGKQVMLSVGLRTIAALLTGKKLFSLGESLIARLRLSMAEAKCEMWLGTPFVDLVQDESGAVIGIRVKRSNGKEELIQTKGGVIFASGGFSNNQALREQYLPKPTDKAWTHSADGATGDTLTAGIRAGAAVSLMDRVWGAPSIPRPNEHPYFLVADRSIPSMIIVDSNGSRYLNECIPYHEFVDKMYAHGAPAMNSWIIIDENTKKRYLFAGLFPGQPFPKSWVEGGTVQQASTPEELARKINVPEEALKATMERFNRLASTGKDTDFNRGESAYDRYYGDPTLPNPNLTPLQAPFYALPVKSGDLDTKGGLLTDECGRVVRPNGAVIAGLYATGNCSSAVMGKTYPGPGATLGPSMCFAYTAAVDIKNKLSNKK